MPQCPTGHRPFGAAALLSLHFFTGSLPAGHWVPLTMSDPWMTFYTFNIIGSSTFLHKSSLFCHNSSCSQGVRPSKLARRGGAVEAFSAAAAEVAAAVVAGTEEAEAVVEAVEATAPGAAAVEEAAADVAAAEAAASEAAVAKAVGAEAAANAGTAVQAEEGAGGEGAPANPLPLPHKKNRRAFRKGKKGKSDWIEPGRTKNPS